MNNVIQFPKKASNIQALKYYYKLFYLEDDGSWWTQMLNTKTREWGDWVKLKKGGD